MTSSFKFALEFFDTFDPQTGKEKADATAFRLTCEGGASALTMLGQAIAEATLEGRAEVMLRPTDGAGEVEQVDDASAPSGPSALGKTAFLGGRLYNLTGPT